MENRTAERTEGLELKTAVTIGKFDGFHLGHQLLLDDIVSVSDERNLIPVIIKLTGTGVGIMSRTEEEAFLMDNYPKIFNCASENSVKPIEYIDFTPEFMRLTPDAFAEGFLVKKLHVSHVSVGVDFRFGKNRAGDTDTLRKLGVELGFTVNVIDKLKLEGETVSSSVIRESLEKGDVIHASLLLGRSYSLTGIVEGGKKLGRNLGYPTVNLGLDSSKLLPRYGVYASEVRIDGTVFRGITNIGIRPSMDDGDKPTVETFIYDFSDDIYGKKVEVIPLGFIREEIHFNSFDELVAQISKDIETARNL